MRYCFVLVWLLLGLSFAAQAQTTCSISASQPSCTPGEDIRAFDNATSTEVRAFCVGRPVRFELCNPPSGFVATYEVLNGNTTALTGCNPTQSSSFVYTPTVAGPVTVFALANDGTSNPIFYRRVYQVVERPVPTFTLEPCSLDRVLVTLTTGTSYDQYFVTIGSGPVAGPFAPGPPIPAFPANGATSVTVTGRYADNQLCDNSSTLTFTPLPVPLPLSFTRLTQATPTAAAQLTLADVQPGYRYTIEIESTTTPGSFQTVGIVPAGTTSYLLPGGTASGCYRLFRTDACGLITDASTPICALALSGTPDPGHNTLRFAYAGASTLRLERDGVLLATLPGGTTSYEDAAIVCGSSYSYRLTAVLPGGQESISNLLSLTAVSSNVPPPAPGVVASFTPENRISLTPVLSSPTLPAGSVLRYSKSTGGAARDFASASTARVVGDSTAFDSLRIAPPCYTLRFVDLCGNPSAPSSPSCPSFLTASTADADGNTVNLSWTPFSGPAPTAPASYELERLAPDGTVLSTLPVSGSAATDPLPPTDRQVLRYRLRISGAGIPAGSYSYSNVTTVTRQVRLLIPNAFTPNGDGLNDVLEVKGRFLADYSFVVVDRNGVEVFRGAQRSDTWDGRINGHAPVNGSYVWRFQQTDETGQLVRRTGTVTILR